MVALAAAAVAEDARAAVVVPYLGEARGDLVDGGVPVDLFVGPVGPASHRGGEPGSVILVVVQPQRPFRRCSLSTRRGICCPGSE